MNKIIVSAVILLFLFCNLSFPAISKENSSTFSGKTLYVGGLGKGNYTKIQDAINNSSDGDTVFVYNGIYNELIRINKSITLQGENKQSTIIDGNFTNSSIVTIEKNNTQIKGFTIRNAPKIKKYVTYGTGIYVYYKKDIGISDNIITNTYYGINYDAPWYKWSRRSTIFNCSINETNIGINLKWCGYFNIYSNKISDSYIGIQLDSSNDNFINNNLFENNQCGFYFYFFYMDDRCYHNEIKYNSFIKNGVGIAILYSHVSNSIIKNNFIKNNKSINYFLNSGKDIGSYGNEIHENYWDRPRLLPKVIFGYRFFIIPIPWIKLDMSPASEPYDISLPEV